MHPLAPQRLLAHPCDGLNLQRRLLQQVRAGVRELPRRDADGVVCNGARGENLVAPARSSLLEAGTKLFHDPIALGQRRLEDWQCKQVFPVCAVAQLHRYIQGKDNNVTHLRQAHLPLAVLQGALLPEELPDGLRQAGVDVRLREKPAQSGLLLVLKGVEGQQLRHRRSHLCEEGGKGDESDEDHGAREDALGGRHRRQILRRRRELRHAPVKRRSVAVPPCTHSALGEPRLEVPLARDAQRVPKAGDEVVEHKNAHNEDNHPRDHQRPFRLNGAHHPHPHLHDPPQAKKPQQPQHPQQPREPCAPKQSHKAI
mmetsp:Transcript_75431/g.217836  ORF Transcript_75431/g.217836 Transcript_75431/m.217836 type:complete len:313 (+) Transcript_75431:462-1400(+)